jgi:hypothetical protein
MRLPQVGKGSNDDADNQLRRTYDEGLLKDPVQKGPINFKFEMQGGVMNLQESQDNAPNALIESFRDAYRAVADGLYENSIADGSRPVEFRLFDREVCKGFDSEWLFREVKEGEICREQFDRIIGSEIIPKWHDSSGAEGFLLYSPEQLKVVKVLQDWGRYSDSELRHFVESWNEKIECTVEVIPYDKLGGDEYIVYCAHVEKEIEDLQRHKKMLEHVGAGCDSSVREFDQQLASWEKTAEWLARCRSSDISQDVRQRISRRLFRLRMMNEIVRISDVGTMRGAILQGYSPEVVFSRYESSLTDFRPIAVNWHFTLSQVQASRSRGKDFPLRTPEFDLTETGFRLRKPLRPDEYGHLFETYGLDQLQAEIQRLANELWHPPSLDANTSLCPECGIRFPKVSAARRYCSDRCRSRAKQQRWRDRDPERARQSIARYWSTNYPDSARVKE